jgi:hypothetical protein
MTQAQADLSISTLLEQRLCHGHGIPRHHGPIEGLGDQARGRLGRIPLPSGVHGDHAELSPQSLRYRSPKRTAKTVRVKEQGKGAVASPILERDFDPPIFQGQAPPNDIIGNKTFGLSDHRRHFR